MFCKHNKKKKPIEFEGETPKQNKDDGEDTGLFASLYKDLKNPSKDKPKEPKDDDILPDDGFFLSTYKKLKKSFDVNIAKLKARYGEKFSSEKAINRDLETERNILEGKN